MTLFVQLAIFVVSAIVSYASRPKTSAPKASVLDDFKFPQGTEGTSQIEVFGTCWVDDWMVLGVGNFRTTPIRK